MYKLNRFIQTLHKITKFDGRLLQLNDKNTRYVLLLGL